MIERPKIYNEPLCESENRCKSTEGFLGANRNTSRTETGMDRARPLFSLNIVSPNKLLK